MTAPHPVASRSTDRTGCVLRSSKRALTFRNSHGGPGFSSPNRPDKGRNPTDRAGSRRDSRCERPLRTHCRRLGGAIWGNPGRASTGERNKPLISISYVATLITQPSDCDFGGLSLGRQGANWLSTRPECCSCMKGERGGYYPNPVVLSPASPPQRAYQGRMDPSQN